tara:strand:- start:114 stop:371 length:258 start_codon:yes stop_codon:yes gene_type:complete
MQFTKQIKYKTLVFPRLDLFHHMVVIELYLDIVAYSDGLGAGANIRTVQYHTVHKTPQQVETYVATANKKRLAKRGIALIDQNKV